MAYTILAARKRPNDNVNVQSCEFYSNSVQIFTFLSTIVLQAYTYDFIQYLFLLSVAGLNVAFIVYSIIKMIPNLWLKAMLVFNLLR